MHNVSCKIMNLLVYGTLLFVSAFLLHIIHWRVRIPKRQIKTLLTLFFFVLVCGTVLLIVCRSSIDLFGLIPPTHPGEWFQIWLYFTALTLSYMITYSAVESDSPSLLIVLKIAEAGTAGFKKASVEEELNDRVLIWPRVDDLLLDKMAVFADGRYHLTPKGKLLANIFIRYRGLMGLGKGG